MITRLILILCAAVSLYGQQTFNYVATTGNVSLSTAATAATLQQPASNQLPIMFAPAPGVGAAVYCSVACVASILTNMVAATTTAGTVNPTIPNQPAAVVKFFTASNASGGTTLVSYNIAAGQTFALDLSSIKLGGASSNVTISIASITGTANITFFPQEIH